MSKLDLRVRSLETGELFHAAFDSEADACRWLMERPRWMEVLGVATHGLPKEVYSMLKTVARPLDREEQMLADRLDAKDEEARRAAEAESRRLDAEELEAYREEQRTADPNRPMTVHWHVTEGLSLDDPFDPREITPEAREAVLAWVRERDEWVKDRGQIIGEAIVTVWPAQLPDGEERVQRGGQFFPMEAPARG